jgi:hypothetical protein
MAILAFADSADEVACLKVLASQNQTLKGVLNFYQDRLPKYASTQDPGAVDLDLIFMKPNLSSEIQSDRAAQRVQLKAFSDEKNKQMALMVEKLIWERSNPPQELKELAVQDLSDDSETPSTPPPTVSDPASCKHRSVVDKTKCKFCLSALAKAVTLAKKLPPPKTPSSSGPSLLFQPAPISLPSSLELILEMANLRVTNAQRDLDLLNKGYLLAPKKINRSSISTVCILICWLRVALYL